MLRFLRVLTLFLVAFLSFDRVSCAGDFTSCVGSMTYVECDAGYYLSDCGSYRDGRTITSPAAGNSCRACPSATSSAYYECSGGAVCPKNMFENEFSISINVPKTGTVFGFNMSASGVFYVNWGDGRAIQKIDRTGLTANTSYTHTYSSTGTKTIKISGQATAYNDSSYEMPAINFYYGSDDTAKLANTSMIRSVSGSLGSVFGTLSTGKNPRFNQLFRGAVNLTSVPSTLFSGITGFATGSMFGGAFMNTGLTSIPDGLFAGISGDIKPYTFSNTFNGCRGLTSIPENLFGNISGSMQSYAFYRMFKDCAALTGRSAKINGQYVYDIWPSATATQVGEMYTNATRLADYPCIPTNYGGTGTGVCVDIVYDANGGTGNPPTSPVVCVFGQPCPAPENTYTYTGKSFAHWKRTINGSNTHLIYPGPGQDILDGLTSAAVKSAGKITLSAQWGNPIRTVTLNNTDMGGIGGTTEVYTTDGVVFYSDAAGTTAIRGIRVPTKQNATYMGHYTTSATSGGAQCIGQSGEFTFASGCEVTSDTRWYARYQCNTGWTDAGTVISGICSKNITVNLNNLYATKKGTEILYARAGSGETFFDENHTNVMPYITIPENVPVFTFDANGGTVDLSSFAEDPNIARVAENSLTFLPVAFTGFYSEKSGGTQYIDATGALTEAGMVAIAKSTGNLTWYAQWASVATVAPMPTPVRDGYRFGQWTGSFDADGQSVTFKASPGAAVSVPTSADFVINWTPKCNEITLNPNAGTAGSTTTLYKLTDSDPWYIDSECSAQLKDLSSVIPSRVGYLFRGFYPQSNEEEFEGDIAADYETSIPAVITSDMIMPEWNTTSASTLYASWVKECDVPDNGKCSVSIGPGGQIVDYTTSCAVGYTLGNENTATPSCTANTYNVRYMPNATNATGTMADELHTFGVAQNLTPNAFTNGTKQFLGWSKDRAATEPEYSDGESVINLSDGNNIRLFAVWGDCTPCAAGTGATCELSAPLGVCTYVGACQPGYGNLVGGDTATPVCTANTYTISFNANGGTGGQSEAVDAIYNSRVPRINTTAPTRTGYTFMGWYDDADYTNSTQYYTAAGDAVRVWDKTENGTLYAGWMANTFSIRYNAGGGTGSAPSAPISCTYGDTCTAPANTYSKTGYEFVGWACMSGSASCAKDVYAEGEDISRATAVNGDLIQLTAQWSQNAFTCLAGEYLPAGATVCETCPAGSYCTGGTFGYSAVVSQGVSACPMNSTSESGKSECTCDTGYTVDGTVNGATTTSGKNCEIIKVTCNPGEYLPAGATECTSCSYEVYCTGGTFEYSANEDQGLTACPTPNDDNPMGANDLIGFISTASDVTGDFVRDSINDCKFGYMFGSLDGSSSLLEGENKRGFYMVACGYDDTSGNYTSDCYGMLGYCDSGYYSELKSELIREENEPVDASYVYQGATLQDVVNNVCKPAGQNYYSFGTLSCYSLPEDQQEQCSLDLLAQMGCSEGDTECILNAMSVRHQCPDGGKTNTDTADSSADCYKSGLSCDVENGNGEQTCNYAYGTSAYDANCTPCDVTQCDTGYIENDNACAPLTYTVKYNANGGTGTMSNVTHIYDVEKALTNNAFTNGTKQFLGWSRSSSATSATYTNGQSVSNLSTTNGSTVNLYAVWGDCTPCAAGTGATCELSAPLGVCTYVGACKTGYNTLVGGDTTTPSCTANTYTVSYAGNGNTGGSAPTSPKSCTYDSDCVAPANTYTKTGYTFAGWTCTGGGESCSGNVIAAGGSLKNVSTGSAITLTAKWTANCNAVTLDANGGTQGSVKTLYKKTGSGTWYTNSTCTTAYTRTTSIIPSRSGYTFRGFYTSDLTDVTSDNSSDTRYFSTNGTAEDSSTSWLITGASTLYAAWAKNCTKPSNGTCSLAIQTYGYVDYTTTCSTGYTISGNNTATPSCTANTYTVSYDGNGNTGGSAPTSPKSCTYGSACTAPANTYTKTGYTFAGWTCTGGGTSCDGDVIAAGGSLKNVSTGSAITLTAKWTINSYTCSAGTYLPKGATECETCSAGSYCIGGTFTYSTAAAQGQSACPSGYGNSDAGSDSEGDCYRACTTSDVVNATTVSGRVYSDGTNACEATGCVTGYSVGELNLHEIIGTIAADSYEESDNGFTVNYGALGSITGRGQCSSQGEPETSPTLPDNSGLYCHCKLDSYTPVGGVAQELSSPWVNYAAYLGCNEWLCMNECATPLVNPDYKVLFDYVPAIKQCVPNTYTVSYAGNGNTGGSAPSEPTSCTYDSDCTAPANTYTKTGYTFAGWTCTGGGESCNGNVIAAGGSLKNVSTGAAITLTAKWTANTYTVSYAANGGSGSAPTSPTSCTYDGTCTAPANRYTKTGYTFAGWTCTGGGEACNGDVIAAGGSLKNVSTGTAITLTAKWTANVYKVTLDKQGGTGGTAEYYYQYKTKGNCYYYTTSDLTVCTDSSNGGTIAVPTRTGYTFGGYYTGTNGSGTQYVTAAGVTTGSLYSNVAADTTLYAKWTANTYTVSFNANGGTGGQSANVTVTYDAAMPAISTTAPSRTGYTFVGWYDNADYASGTQYYSETGASARTWNKTANTTLYAGWTKNGYNCKAGEYLNVTACKVCESGYYCPSAAVSYTYNGQIQGRTACSNRPGNAVYTSATGNTSSSCPWTCNAGYYGSSANGDASCAVCGTGNYCTGGLNRTACSKTYANTTTTTTTATSASACVCEAGFGGTSAGSCTACAKGYYKASAGTVECTVAQQNYYVATTGAKAQTACTTLGSFYTKTASTGSDDASDCYGTTTAGKYVAEAKRAEITCAAGGYCPGSVNVNYGSYGDAGGRTACAAGKYNANTGSSEPSACVACAIGSYAVGTGNTACTACAAGTTTTATGHTSATCSACANNNDYDNSWATPSWTANQVTNLCKISNCKAGSKYSSATGTNTTGSCTVCEAGTYQATNGSTATSCSAVTSGCYGAAGATSACPRVCGENQYSDAGASECVLCATPYGYGNTGTTAEEHAGRASCKTVCDAGMYVATAGAACENVGAGYYAPGGEVSYGSISKNRGQCPVQLTTIGYGYGANEADDCGRKLHAGDGVVYLRSAKKNPDELALNVRLNITNDNGASEERVFFGNMTTEEKFMSDGVAKALKINVDDTVYYVHDDSVM